MNEFVNSLKRLYEANKLSEEKINNLVEMKKITKEECLYILGKDGK